MSQTRCRFLQFETRRVISVICGRADASIREVLSQVMQEIPKSEDVNAFTYRRLASVEFLPILDQLSYVWLWSAADDG